MNSAHLQHRTTAAKVNRSMDALLLALFFLSGALGLVYEIVWLRVLGLVFGNTTFATSAVLCGFMAGLGLGALYFGRKIDRTGHPLFFYGLLEVGTGAYALITPLIWQAIEFLSVHFYRWASPSFYVFGLFKFILAFFVLFVPTFLMGGTLPVLTRFITHTAEEGGRKAGLLYSINTFGAMAGVIFCGFFALYTLGMAQTVWLAAAGYLCLGVFCINWSRRLRPVSEVTARKTNVYKTAGCIQRIILLILFAVSGALSMAYEIAWTRVLALSLGSSVYAFSVMLATFLLGIALGSFFFTKYTRKFPVHLFTLAVLQLFISWTVLLGLNHFDEMPFYFIQMYSWLHTSIWAVETGKFLLSALIMLPPTFSIGAAFACFVHIYQSSSELGREVGEAYFSNTLGSIVGSFSAGFFIIPLLGIQQVLVGAAWINMLIAVTLLLLAIRSWTWKRILIPVALILFIFQTAVSARPWDQTVLASGAPVYANRSMGASRADFLHTIKQRKPIFYKEGINATVSVTKKIDTLSLSVNGKVDASNSEDAFTQFFLGHLPMMLTRDAKRVAIIGLGSGSTAAAVAAYPVDQIRVIEIEPGVVEAARFFSKLNRNVLDDPHVEIAINDGRNDLLVRPDVYDVIISEPSNPWMAGVANLFSVEHYELMKSRLADEGVVCQWFHAYSMSPDDLRMVMNTFSAVFEHTSLWFPYFPDLILIGTKQPQVADFNRIKTAFDIPAVRGDFARHGIRHPEGFFSCFLLDDSNIRSLVKHASINTDNLPLLEFSAPRHIYENTVKENFALLFSARDQMYPKIEHLHPPAAENVDLHIAVAQGFIAKALLVEAQQVLSRALEFAPGNAEFYTTLGLLTYKLNKPSDAKDSFLRAVLIDPENTEARYYLSLIYAAEKYTTRALEEAAEAVRLVPAEARYLKQLGDLLYGQKEWAGALKIYNEIMKKGDGEYDVFSRVVEIVFKLDEPMRAAVMASAFLEEYSYVTDAYDLVARLYESKGLHDEALKTYEKMLTIFPGEAKTYLGMGRILEKMNQADEAKMMLKRAVELQPALEEAMQKAFSIKRDAE